jgi:hypothetical protein
VKPLLVIRLVLVLTLRLSSALEHLVEEAESRLA